MLYRYTRNLHFEADWGWLVAEHLPSIRNAQVPSQILGKCVTFELFLNSMSKDTKCADTVVQAWPPPDSRPFFCPHLKSLPPLSSCTFPDFRVLTHLGVQQEEYQTACVCLCLRLTQHGVLKAHACWSSG